MRFTAKLLKKAESGLPTNAGINSAMKAILTELGYAVAAVRYQYLVAFNVKMESGEWAFLAIRYDGGHSSPTNGLVTHASGELSPLKGTSLSETNAWKTYFKRIEERGLNWWNGKPENYQSPSLKKLLRDPSTQASKKA